MDFLVGFTGFVGSNLKSSHKFDGLFNRQNIQKAYRKQPDLLVYAGIPAEKYLANNFPDKDFKIIKQAIYNLQKIKPQKLVLISTIDVYEKAVDVNEDDLANAKEIYGKNRHFLENWVKENVPDFHIVRLPALFGSGIKKNFIYDLIHISPALLTKKKYEKFSQKSALIKVSYQLQENGFYKLQTKEKRILNELKKEFLSLGFSALNFTDSRAVFPFYHLKDLWQDIQWVIKENIPLINLAIEPLAASEVYQAVFYRKFVNELKKPIAHYDFKTKYSSSGYLKNKEKVLKELTTFVKGNIESPMDEISL
ncbi:MAG: NAD(P)-dependent oxidoreductase [Streptococcaceae bacterium]|nr:NAD(P)-dependent oxidoreductase [Streptococcaceae bacterium]